MPQEQPEADLLGCVRRCCVRVLVVVGGVLAALGLVAGHVNRQLLDGPTFAVHVDEIRRDDDVAAASGG